MRVWWIAYNRRLFDGALVLPAFNIADITHFGEYADGCITLSSRFQDYNVAKATLVHEMVHQWQHANGKAIGHGREFTTWRDLILAEINMEI